MYEAADKERSNRAGSAIILMIIIPVSSYLQD